jgi:hypothetical protein
MATVNATSQAQSICNFASGGFTGDGTITTINIGFKPRLFKIFNANAATVYEKFEGMVAANSIKTVTAGTTTNDASAITLNADGTVTIPSAIAINTNVFSWIAFG